MGRRIGRLGHVREPLDLEFDYFDGAAIRVHPQASDQVEVEFLEAGKDIDVEALEGIDMAKLEAMDEQRLIELMRTMTKAQAAGYRAMMSALRQLIHPDDFDLYWQLGVKHGQQIRDRMADVRSITDAVLEETSDFQRTQRAGSPRGPEPTPVSSTADLPQPAARPGTDLERALALERGRPDIQEFFLMRSEAEQEEAQARVAGAERDRRMLAEAGLTG